MIVALDACTIIYLIEASSPIADVARGRLRELLAEPAARALCSRLPCLECRVGPMRVGDVAW